jgi:endophilin-B
MKSWTERLISHVETVLQPNPSKLIFSGKIIIKYLFLDERLEDFILTKFDQKQTNKPNIIEQLGQSMTEAGNDFGPSTQYGMNN